MNALSRRRLSVEVPFRTSVGKRHATVVPTWRRSWVFGAVLAVAILPLYLHGLDRPYGYDESVTIGNFVDTGSLLDALRLQVVNNNHPLLSLMDHLIFSATGRHDEAIMRLIPLSAALAALVVLTAVCIRRFGMLAGVSAGAFLGTNPFFASEAQSVRGYTLLLLFAIISTALVTEDSPRTWKSVAYILAVAAGTATHVYMVPVVVFQAVYLSARGQLTRHWSLRMLAGCIIGAVPVMSVLTQMGSSGRGTLFRPELPHDIVMLVFPGYSLIALAPLALLVIRRYGRRRDITMTLVTIAAMIGFMWLVVRPFDLYARFFCWTLPLVAAGIAAQIKAFRPWCVAAVAGVATVLFTQYSAYGAPEEANRQVASAIDQANARGLRVCGLGDMNSFDAYTRHYSVLAAPSDLSRCDLAVAVWLPWSKPDESVVRAVLPIETVYADGIPISVFERSSSAAAG